MHLGLVGTDLGEASIELRRDYRPGVATCIYRDMQYPIISGRVP